MFWHTARDDTMFTSMRCVSRHEKSQVYGKAPKEKYVQKKAESNTSPKKKTIPASKGSRLKSSAKVAKTDKKKQTAKMPKTKGLVVLSSGSGDIVDTQSKVPDEQQQKVSGTNEGAGVRPEVLDVPKYDSESDEESWTFSQDEEDANEETDVNDDSDETESDNDGDNLTHPNLLTYKADDEEEEEEKVDDKEMSSDQREQDDEDDLYRDVNINLERSDAEMSDAQANKDTEDAHFINPSPDTCIDSILNPNIQSHTLVNVPVSVTAETPSSDTTIPPPPIPINQPLQQTPESTTTTTIPTTTLPDIPNFASLFRFEQWVSALETEMSEFKQTNQFAKAVSLIPGIVDNYLASKMKETVDVVVQLQTNKLREEAQAENHEFLNQVDSTMKAIIKEQVQAQVSKIMPKIEKYVTESQEAKVLVRSTNQPQTSYAVAASLSEFELKKILIDKMETNKSIDRSNVQKDLYKALVESYNSDKDIIFSYGDVVTLKRGRNDQDKDEDPSAGSNRGSKRRRSGKEAESSKEPTHKESKSTSSSKDQPHQEFNTGNDDETHVREALDADECLWNTSSTTTPDRECLKGGSSSQKYTTSVTKMKAADYGQVKWIKDKKFYGYASNMESSKDVYSRHKIIVVTSLKIMKYFGYSHLEEIIV
ncbi:hypothetical protein Tco_1183295 [Tanacetum coccineum]